MGEEKEELGDTPNPPAGDAQLHLLLGGKAPQPHALSGFPPFVRNTGSERHRACRRIGPLSQSLPPGERGLSSPSMGEDEGEGEMSVMASRSPDSRLRENDGE